MEPRPGEIIRRRFLSPGLSLQYDLDADAGAVHHHVSVGGDMQWQSMDELRFENLGRARQGAMQSNENIDAARRGRLVFDRVGFAKDWTLMLSGRYDGIANHLRDILDPDTSSEGLQSRDRPSGAGVGAENAVQLYANFRLGSCRRRPRNCEQPGWPQRHQPEPHVRHLDGRGDRGSRLLPHAFTYEVAAFHLDTKDDIGRYRAASTGAGAWTSITTSATRGATASKRASAGTDP